jgi:hypothetical protein
MLEIMAQLGHAFLHFHSDESRLPPFTHGQS